EIWAIPSLCLELLGSSPIFPSFVLRQTTLLAQSAFRQSPHPLVPAIPSAQNPAASRQALRLPIPFLSAILVAIALRTPFPMASTLVPTSAPPGVCRVRPHASKPQQFSGPLRKK